MANGTKTVNAMKTETLYSRADWKFHKDRLGYDDVVDHTGRFVATVHVMAIAAAEMLQASYLAGGAPREISYARPMAAGQSIFPRHGSRQRMFKPP